MAQLVRHVFGAPAELVLRVANFFWNAFQLTQPANAGFFRLEKMHMTTPRGVRNRNPGNIDHTPRNAWVGQLGMEPKMPGVPVPPVRHVRHC